MEKLNSSGMSDLQKKSIEAMKKVKENLKNGLIHGCGKIDCCWEFEKRKERGLGNTSGL